MIKKQLALKTKQTTMNTITTTIRAKLQEKISNPTQFTVAIIIAILIVIIGLSIIDTPINPNHETKVQYRFINETLLSHTEIVSKKELLKAFGWALSGLILLYTAILTNKRNEATNKQIRQAEENLQITRLSRTDNRFNDAAKGLGSDSSVVRLCSIQTLYSIGFVEDKTSSHYTKLIFDILRLHIIDTTRKIEYQEKNESSPALEIQTIFELLFSKESKNVSKAIFTNCHLEGLNKEHLDKNKYEIIKKVTTTPTITLPN